jgi:hypothetical protein
VAKAPSWRLPPLSWYKRQPPDRPVQECMREYYKLHPKHMPPPEVRKQWQRPLRPISLSEMRAREVRDGKPDSLIFHLQNGGALGLGAAEVQLLIELLEAKRGKQYRDQLRDVEQFRIAQQVDSLVREGVKTEAAVLEVATEHRCSARHVYDVMKAKRQVLKRSAKL